VNTPLGVASIDWQIVDGGNLTAKVVVPFGSKAVLDFPTTSGSTVRVNGKAVSNKHEVSHGHYDILVSAPAVASFKVA
jgi:alpha-L-rhamnosidase